jgi:CPA1 family monovalent cation:H+ antiporter
MKRTRAPADIRMKITGEALFNDAASIVLFVIISQYLTGRALDLNYIEITGLLLKQGVGGIALGYVLGWITAYFMRMIHNEETPILMSLALVTGGYSIATFLDVSGPICMVVAGLVVGSHSRKPQFANDDRSLRLHNFWGLIDDVLNSFLFALIGLQILSIKTRFSEILLGLTVFLIVIIVRGISVGGPLLILEPLNKFNWRVLTIMTWGGMRGGLSIALALSIPASQEKDIIVGITYAVVVFSIIFQGLSIQAMIRKLLPTRREMQEQLSLFKK